MGSRRSDFEPGSRIFSCGIRTGGEWSASALLASACLHAFSIWAAITLARVPMPHVEAGWSRTVVPVIFHTPANLKPLVLPRPLVGRRAALPLANMPAWPPRVFVKPLAGAPPSGIELKDFGGPVAGALAIPIETPRLPASANRPVSNQEDVFSASVRPSAITREKNDPSLGMFDMPQGVPGAPLHMAQPAQMGAFERSAPRQAPPAGRRIVLESGFDGGEPHPERPKAPPIAQPAITPVEILSKPKPAYTAEARLAGVEGSVILDVLFAASGRVEVLRVVRGLGYGLDDAAIDAARKILFRPATAGGKPADCRATVRIVFQLAF